MPGLGHPVAGALGGDDEPVQLPRQADGEIADVDHLLHFAETLGHDLADLKGHERAESLFRSAQFLAEKAHEFAPAGRRNLAPGEKGGPRAIVDRRHVMRRRLPDAGDLGAVDRRASRERTAPKLGRGQDRPGEAILAGHRSASYVFSVRGRRGPLSRSPLFDPNSGRPASPTSFTPSVGAKISAGFIHVTALFRIHDAKSLALRRAGPAG